MYVNSDALLRSLPNNPDVIEKLKSGLYELYGGVVRHAAGTEKGGRIVCHLLFPSDSQQTQEQLKQLESTLANGFRSFKTSMGELQQSIGVLQGLQSANFVMSGLNLAVTTAGFVIVCKKLNGISDQIQAQSELIAQTYGLVKEVHERNILTDEAQFRALILTAQQFCELGDVGHLKGLIAPFHKEYQFTKLVLEKHALIAASSVARLGEIALLQDRLVNLGLTLSHVQMRTGAVKYSRECMVQLETDLKALNAKRIEVLTSDGKIASAIKRDQFNDMTNFLLQRRQISPALTYQADALELEMRYPGLLQQTSQSKEIQMIYV